MSLVPIGPLFRVPPIEASIRDLGLLYTNATKFKLKQSNLVHEHKIIFKMDFQKLSGTTARGKEIKKKEKN